ncbi:hypothetical protein [Fructobacillus fructosus]|uniref:hypothetical protein n=1 Tax=Fructobacillus fructosus TaxID=1631 RepID=UPI002DA04CD1|nr:hypothetical protein LMG30235_GOPAMIKF_00494 [Fructobacillus fructosus]CAK1232352.1 hypothetical protein LMG30234_GAICNKDF_00491 [Fructobacillus fructosus]CAK1232449.1 hypothetical protein R54866_LGPIEIPA_00496 [Fructobacillus fructosus]
MQAINIPANELIKVLVGQDVSVDQTIQGSFLLVAEENHDEGLPSAMAAAVADIALGHVQLQKLVHPLRVAVNQPIWTPYQFDESFLTAEPHNWFGPEAIVLEKRFEDFTKSYKGPRDANGRIPSNQVPDEIAKPLLIEDAYWAAYAHFVNDPNEQFKKQLRPIFSNQ